jgi:hypothetical protein
MRFDDTPRRAHTCNYLGYITVSSTCGFPSSFVFDLLLFKKTSLPFCFVPKQMNTVGAELRSAALQINTLNGGGSGGSVGVL